jgi:hypothetical protein
MNNLITVNTFLTHCSNAKVAVIGGLALWNYVQNGRTTEVIHYAVLAGLC